MGVYCSPQVPVQVLRVLNSGTRLLFVFTFHILIAFCAYYIYHDSVTKTSLAFTIGSNSVSTSGSIGVPLDEWVFIVGTYDMSSKTGYRCALLLLNT